MTPEAWAKLKKGDTIRHTNGEVKKIDFVSLWQGERFIGSDPKGVDATKDHECWTKVDDADA